MLLIAQSVEHGSKTDNLASGDCFVEGERRQKNSVLLTGSSLSKLTVALHMV